MRKFYLLLIASLITLFSFAQGTETFTNIPASSSSYATRTWTGDGGISWTSTDSRTEQYSSSQRLDQACANLARSLEPTEPHSCGVHSRPSSNGDNASTVAMSQPCGGKRAADDGGQQPNITASFFP